MIINSFIIATHREDMSTPQNNDGVSVPKILAYSGQLGTTAPLHLLNHSAHTFVFKIRTNQKHALSLHSSHGFLRAHSQLEVAVKIIDKPNAAIPLKLQVNYALATPEDIVGNDSKRAINSKQDMTKRVIVLRQGSKIGASGKGTEGPEKPVTVEEQSALDSSIKKEDSQSHYPTAGLNLFPIIRTPMKEPDPEQSQNQQSVSSLFRHTFSLDHDEHAHSPAPTLSQRQIKMEAVGKVVQAPSPPPSSRQQSFNPFEALIQTVKNESNIVIEMKQKDEPQSEYYQEHEINPQSPVLISAPSAEAFNPFSFLAQSAKRPSPSAEKQQEWPLGGSQQGSMRVSHLSRRPIVDSKIIQDDEEYIDAQKREIEELSIRIELIQGFIKDLERISVPAVDKLFPIWLFVLLSILAFILGGASKHFLF